MPDRKPAQSQERHRRMAVGPSDPLRWADQLTHWVKTGEKPPMLSLVDRAQLIATVERDARAEGFAEGVSRAVKHECALCKKDEPPCPECTAVIRHLLPEPPRSIAIALGERAFERAARICEQTLPPGFRAMSQDWRDGYLVCQREVARAIRERGGK